MLSKLYSLGLIRVPLAFQSQFGFATKMSAGSTAKTKDSIGRRLGVKKFGSEEVFPDDILIRQRGFKWKPGQNTYYGKDHTIHSKIEGVVYFEQRKHSLKKKFQVNVIPRENPNRVHRPPPPYCYHPELFPDLAMKNPKPVQIPKKLVWKTQNVLEEKSPYFNVLKDSQFTKSIKIPDSYYASFPQYLPDLKNQ